MKITKNIVLGFGTSGRSCAELLLKDGQSVIALDSKVDELRNEAFVSEFIKRGGSLLSDQTSLDWSGIYQLVVSPGISLSHPVVVQAKEKGIDVIGEVELAFRYLTNRCIGVTGTNGKTTVVMLIDHVLRASGYSSCTLGNIGTTLSSYAIAPKPQDILVVELSSFQLETLSRRSLDAAVILNITPDHLDRYATIDEYAQAKCQIEHCLKPGGKLWVSRQTATEYGHLLHRPCVLEDVPMEMSSVAAISPMRYIQLGVPERQNVQAAFVICRHFGVTDLQFWRALETFRKPKHRIEFVGEWMGTSFYNDSKATNIDSVMHAISLFEGPIILLAGGVHKGWSYRPWIASFNGKVSRVIAFGQASPVIEKDLSDTLAVERVETLEQAVCAAIKYAAPQTTILLSPGCSSYDQFRNYEHRGDEFKRIFKEKVWIERKQS